MTTYMSTLGTSTQINNKNYEWVGRIESLGWMIHTYIYRSIQKELINRLDEWKPHNVYR